MSGWKADMEKVGGTLKTHGVRDTHDRAAEGDAEGEPWGLSGVSGAQAGSTIREEVGAGSQRVP